MVSKYWNGAGRWNIFPWKTQTRLNCRTKIIAWPPLTINRSGAYGSIRKFVFLNIVDICPQNIPDTACFQLWTIVIIYIMLILTNMMHNPTCLLYRYIGPHTQQIITIAWNKIELETSLAIMVHRKIQPPLWLENNIQHICVISFCFDSNFLRVCHQRPNKQCQH